MKQCILVASHYRSHIFARLTSIVLVMAQLEKGPTEICRHLIDVSRATVFRKEGYSITHRFGAGQPLKLNGDNTTDLAKQGVNISQRTTRPYLRRMGFRNLLLKRVPLLTRQQD